MNFSHFASALRLELLDCGVFVLVQSEGKVKTTATEVTEPHANEKYLSIENLQNNNMNHVC
jgi:short-subunit dehydrogenase